jgi:hypothetical protein
MADPRMSMTLFPKLHSPERPVWDDAVRLSHYDTFVRHFVYMEARGEMTREEALISALYASYNHRAERFKADCDARGRT